MSEGVVYLPVDTLYHFMIDVFEGVGVPAADAKTCADVLIAADLRGIESHGIQRLKMYYDRIKAGLQQPVTEFEILRESPTTALVDGHHGMGHVISVRAMQLAIDKAKQYGMGGVAVRNSSHFGIDGYYPLMAIQQGMIGMSFTNARPSTAPTFSVQPVLGTNPIAFGAPSDEDCPFLFDAATSLAQRGKVEVHARTGEPVPVGWVTGQDGETLTDPKQILTRLGEGTAALLPLGGPGEDLAGYKGYGLATVVEILSASLQSGYYLHDLLGFAPDGKRRPFGMGHFFMAIDIAAFVPLDEFKATTGGILRELRTSRKAPGQARIYTAGEKEHEMEAHVREHGVPLVPSLQAEMKLLQAELGLTQYELPF